MSVDLRDIDEFERNKRQETLKGEEANNTRHEMIRGGPAHVHSESAIQRELQIDSDDFGKEIQV